MSVNEVEFALQSQNFLSQVMDGLVRVRHSRVRVVHLLTQLLVQISLDLLTN